MPRVLLVEDDPAMAELVRAALSARNLQVDVCASAEEALEPGLSGPFDLLVTDIQLPGMSGVDLCARMAQSRPDVPVVVVTAYGSMDSAVAALRAGAFDFITKPLDVRHLTHVAERAISTRELREEVRRLREVVGRKPDADGILGESPVMVRLRELIARVAPTEASVLVMGESGTGKELIARALTRGSARAGAPFIAVNCAALPEPLLESELFGHVKGAFTDARASRDGLFVQASGGTLFLDEIAELPLSLQPKFLRALQERTIRPVGGRAEIPVDVRIIAATNTDLASAVEENRFRADLFYRLNVISVDVPPLRVRGNDVLLLAQQFLRDCAARNGKKVEGLLPATAAKLLEYDWPGNVRELQNCMERAVTLTNFDRLSLEDLPEHIRRFERSAIDAAVGDDSDLPSLEEVERRHIRRVLQAMGGNKTMAARVLGVDRTTLYRKLAQMKLGETGTG